MNEQQPTNEKKGVLSAEATELNHRAKSSVKLMLGRQALLQVLTISGGLILARALTPEMFGIFGIATFFVQTLSLIGDFGLAPSLIQRREELKERDLQVAFTLQQILLSTVAIIIWSGAPYFLQIYPDLGSDEITWLIRALAITLFLQSWRSLSVLQMERRLDFKKVALVEIVEAISYQGIAVGLALSGWGVWSLVSATLARGVLGTVIAYVASPWPIRLAWDAQKAREILSFGIPFQAGAILNSATGWVTPLAVGTMIGPAGIGFLAWAAATGGKPQLLIGSIIRVAFPHLARLQNDQRSLARAFDRYLYVSAGASGIWLVLIVVSAAEITPIVYTSQWVPAIPALRLYAALLPISMLAWTAGTLLRSTGFVSYNLRVLAISSIATIIASASLITTLGILAVPVGAFFGGLLKLFAFAYRLTPECCQALRAATARTALAVTLGLIAGHGTQLAGHTGFIGGLVQAFVGAVFFTVTMVISSPVWIRIKIRAAFTRATKSLRQCRSKTI